MGAGKLIIDRSDFAQRYRFRCPRGHSNWRAYGEDKIVCKSCNNRAPDSPSDYSVLVDEKTGEEIGVSEVEVR